MKVLICYCDCPDDQETFTQHGYILENHFLSPVGSLPVTATNYPALDKNNLLQNQQTNGDSERSADTPARQTLPIDSRSLRSTFSTVLEQECKDNFQINNAVLGHPAQLDQDPSSYKRQGIVFKNTTGTKMTALPGSWSSESRDESDEDEESALRLCDILFGEMRRDSLLSGSDEIQETRPLHVNHESQDTTPNLGSLENHYQTPEQCAAFYKEEIERALKPPYPPPKEDDSDW